VTDRNSVGGMFNLADRDIDKIFGDNLGVSEPVGRTLVNTGGTDPSITLPVAPATAPVNNFAPPQQPAQAPAAFAAPASAEPASDPANKGLFLIMI